MVTPEMSARPNSGVNGLSIDPFVKPKHTTPQHVPKFNIVRHQICSTVPFLREESAKLWYQTGYTHIYVVGYGTKYPVSTVP